MVFLRDVLMKFFILFTALASIFMLPSCDKHNRLIEEVKKGDVELKGLQAEMAVLDSKLAVYGVAPDTATLVLERQNAEWARKNTALEVELAAKTKQCNEAEAAMKEFRPRVDAYKAKYFR